MKLILDYLKKYTVTSTLGPFFRLFEACLELLLPLVVMETIDKGAHTTDKNYIFGRTMMIVVFGLVGFACSLIAQYFADYSAAGASSDIKTDAFVKVNRMKMTVIDGFSVSEIFSTVMEDSEKVRVGIASGLTLILHSPVIVLGTIIMAFTIDARFAFIFAVIIPVLFAIVYSTMFLTLPSLKKLQDDEYEVRPEEGMDSSSEGSKDRSESGKASALEKDRRKPPVADGGILSAVMNPLTYAVLNILMILVIRVSKGQMTIGMVSTGGFIAIINYMILILVELVKLAGVIVVESKASVSAARVERLLRTGSIIEKDGESEETEERGSAVTVQPVEENEPEPGDEYVLFDKVSLMYSQATEAAVSNLSFFVNKGELVVITGSAGSGKTSVVSMITGMYEATEGEIRLFGRSVRDIPMKELRSRVHVALQNAPVFKGTFRDNLTMGKKNVSDEEILEAVAIVGAESFITPDMLDRPLYQDGGTITGGQRQRLQLARTLLRRSDVMIFDDALSSIDYETEVNFWKEFDMKRSDTAAIVVSQRISGLAGADRIIVMDEGSVIGMGEHNELMETCPKYKEIYMAGMR